MDHLARLKRADASEQELLGVDKDLGSEHP